MSGLTIDEDLKKRNMEIVLNHSGPFPNMSWTGLSSAANWIKRHLHVSAASYPTILSMQCNQYLWDEKMIPLCNTHVGLYKTMVGCANLRLYILDSMNVLAIQVWYWPKLVKIYGGFKKPSR